MSEENTEKIPSLETLRFNAGIRHPDSVANYCYDYIYDRFWDYQNANAADIEIYYQEDDSYQDKGKMLAQKTISHMDEVTESFVAELHEAMMYFLLDNPPVAWPEAKVKVVLKKTGEWTKAISGSDRVWEETMERFFTGGIIIDLLKERKLPNHTTELERKLADMKTEASQMSVEAHPIRRFIGWLISILLGINLLEGLLYRLLKFDMEEWLRTFVCDKLTGIGAGGVADGLKWFLKNFIVTPDKNPAGISGGQITAAIFVTAVFLLITGLLIMSSRDHKDLKRRIAALEASEELKIQRERRQQVRDRYHEMMEQWREAVQK